MSELSSIPLYMGSMLDIDPGAVVTIDYIRDNYPNKVLMEADLDRTSDYRRDPSIRNLGRLMYHPAKEMHRVAKFLSLVKIRGWVDADALALAGLMVPLLKSERPYVILKEVIESCGGQQE